MPIIWSNQKCNLPCFTWYDFSFPVPRYVQRSITADIVRTGIRNVLHDRQSQIFSALRKSEYYQTARLAWEDARTSFEFFKNNPNSDIRAITKELKDTSKKYKFLLCCMAQYGIWNCGEFADFALIVIDETKSLNTNMYVASVVTLNNPKIPEAYEHENHDHVFVLITDKQNNKKFVIDLWQGLVCGTPFFGTFNEYLIFLNTTQDGLYVRADVVENHFRMVSETYTNRASGVLDEQSRYHAVPTAPSPLDTLPLFNSNGYDSIPDRREDIAMGANYDEAFSGQSLDGTGRPISHP